MAIEPQEVQKEATIETPAATPAEMSVKPQKKRGLVLFLVGFFVVLGLFLVVGIGIVLSQVNKLSNSPAIVRLADFFQVSAITVDGQGVRYGEYMQQRDALDKFAKSNPMFVSQYFGKDNLSLDEVSDIVVSRLVTTKVIEQVAEKYSVKVTGEQVESKKNEIVSQYESPEVAEEKTREMSGWSVDRVAQTLALTDAVADFVMNSTNDEWKAFELKQADVSHLLFLLKAGDKEAVIKAQASQAIAAMKKKTFEEVAQSYVSKEEKKKEEDRKIVLEDLGWLSSADAMSIDNSFLEAALKLESGKTSSEPVKSRFGFHIIKVNSERTIRDFNKFLQNAVSTAKISMRGGIHNPFASPSDQTGAESK